MLHHVSHIPTSRLPRPVRRHRRAIVALVTSLALAATACGGDDDDGASEPAGTESFGDLTQDHVEGDLDYPQSPPVGGDHNPVWQNCGVYPEPVADENAVHALEHGAVWIAYADNLPADDVATLEGKTEGHSYLLVAPYPGLTDPVVLTAWGKQLRLDSTTDPRVDEFVDAFEEGPQTPEPGAPCTGGVGTPA